MRKVFRAIDEGVCEKMWIGDSAKVPDGWHDNTLDALRLRVKRGRPKKEAPAPTPPETAEAE